MFTFIFASTAVLSWELYAAPAATIWLVRDQELRTAKNIAAVVVSGVYVIAGVRVTLMFA